MYIITNQNITRKMYINLIKYCCEKCNVFSFHIPNYLSLHNAKNRYDSEKVKNEILNKFNEYNIVPLTTRKGYYASGFWNTNVESDIYFYNINDSVMKNVLLKTNNIFDWMWPEQGEDLRFYIDKKCWLSVTSHEKLILVYTKSNEEIERFKKIGFILEEFQDVSNDIPF